MQPIPRSSPPPLRNGAHGLHREHIIRLRERNDHVEEELLSARRVDDLPDDQSLGLAVVGGLLLRLGGQFALARRRDQRRVERDVELVAAQLGREVRRELDHDVHLVFRRVLHDRLHQDGREERPRRAVVHGGERAVRPGEVQHVVLLEAGHVHGGVEVHVVHAQGVGLVLAGATHHDVVVQTDVEARMALQSVPHLDGAFEGAVGDLRLERRREKREGYVAVEDAVHVLDHVDVQVARRFHLVHDRFHAEVLAHQRGKLVLRVRSQRRRKKP